MKITNKTLFKATGVGAESCHGGRGKWYKPHSQTRPGKWMPLIKDICPCKRGYHVCEGVQIFHWFSEELYEVEIRGKQTQGLNKIVAEQARLVKRIKTWNDRTVRLFACDCAKRVLHIFEEKYPEDKRPRKAIEVARKHAKGEAAEAELKEAAVDAVDAADAVVDAVDAADAAADTAAYYAVKTAADAAYYAAARAAYYAASNATSYAVYAYTAGAAYAAAVKERQWQYKQLLKYLNGELS